MCRVGCQDLHVFVGNDQMVIVCYHSLIVVTILDSGCFPLIEGSLEVQLPTVWTGGKAEVGRVREAKKRSEKIREEKE